ncbi:MAG: hypothetical protein N2B01_06315, partial [Psychrobacter cryohalolentis]
DNTHFALTKAHSVSAVFLAEMKTDAVGCSQVGTEARLKKAETACLERQERATTAFRMINSSQLNNAAIEKVFQRLRDQITEFHSTSLLSGIIPTLPAGNPLRRELNDLLSIVRHAENAINLITEETQDSRQTNRDLFSLHASEYIEAAADRRKLWLDNSRLRLDVQRELAKLPIDTFSDTTKDPGDLLGARATIRLTQELEARVASQSFRMSEVTLQAVSKFKPPSKPNQSSNKPKTPKKKKQNNNSGTFRGNDNQDNKDNKDNKALDKDDSKDSKSSDKDAKSKGDKDSSLADTATTKAKEVVGTLADKAADAMEFAAKKIKDARKDS